jgi:sortase family protein
VTAEAQASNKQASNKQAGERASSKQAGERASSKQASERAGDERASSSKQARDKLAGDRARGVARVDVTSKPSAQGKAAVPGALSLPRPTPSVWRSVAPPTVLFEPLRPPIPEDATATVPAAETLPAAEETAETVTPEPTRPDATPLDVGDGSPPVRKKGFLRRAALPAASAAVAALVVGTTYLLLADGAVRIPSDLGRWGASPMATMPPAIEGAGNAGRPPGDPFGSAATAAQGAPTRVRVAAIDLDSPLETLHLGAKGALVPPKRFDRAGWYADGTAPGDIGPAVLAGHVDSKAGPAVFYRLRELATGDKIEVLRGGAVLRFTVTRIAWYPKNKFPTDEVYGPTPDRQLRLITCGGVFDHSLRSYKDNLVVYAAG